MVRVHDDTRTVKNYTFLLSFLDLVFLNTRTENAKIRNEMAVDLIVSRSIIVHV